MKSFLRNLILPLCGLVSAASLSPVGCLIGVGIGVLIVVAMWASGKFA